jgi:hypothetical protein
VSGVDEKHHLYSAPALIDTWLPTSFHHCSSKFCLSASFSSSPSFLPSPSTQPLNPQNIPAIQANLRKCLLQDAVSPSFSLLNTTLGLSISNPLVKRTPPHVSRPFCDSEMTPMVPAGYSWLWILLAAERQAAAAHGMNSWAGDGGGHGIRFEIAARISGWWIYTFSKRPIENVSRMGSTFLLLDSYTAIQYHGGGSFLQISSSERDGLYITCPIPTLEHIITINFYTHLSSSDSCCGSAPIPKVSLNPSHAFSYNASIAA